MTKSVSIKFINMALICLLLHVGHCNFIFFSLTKQLYVPGQQWSQLALNHQLNTLTPYVFEVNAEFVLSQTTQYDQTNSVFDFFRTNQNFDALKSFNYLDSLYDQYQPCQEKCRINYDESNSLRLTQVNEKIGDENSDSASLFYIIDNTFYPCEKGVYEPQLFLFQQINFTIEANSTFWALLQVGCVVLLQILIMLIIYILIMFNKLHHKKSKLLQLKQQEDNKDVLKNFLNSKSHY